jgi:hypothetical protein
VVLNFVSFFYFLNLHVYCLFTLGTVLPLLSLCTSAVLDKDFCTDSGQDQKVSTAADQCSGFLFLHPDPDPGTVEKFSQNLNCAFLFVMVTFLHIM